MKPFFIVLCVAAVICLTNAEDHSMKDFETGPFTVSPPPNLYHLTDLGLDSVIGGAKVLGIGDFNNDKHTDLIVANDANSRLSIFLWEHENGAFAKSQDIKIEDGIIRGVALLDANYDGKLDFIVTVDAKDEIIPQEVGESGTVVKNASVIEKVRMYVYLQTSLTDGELFQKPTISKTYSYQQPTIASLDGDREVDLLLNDDNGARIVLEFKNKSSPLQNTTSSFSEYVSANEKCISYDLVSNRTLTQPNFNSFIDLTGDCRADLFLMTQDTEGNKYFEIWVDDGENKYCLVENIKIDFPIVSLAFADVDKDSALDLVFVQQDANETISPKIHIVYNQFPGSISDGPCARATTFTSPFFTLEGEDVMNSATNSKYKTVYSLSSLRGFDSTFRLFSWSKDLPHQLRFGDVNLDGYQDVLVTVYDSFHTDTMDRGYTYALYNSICDTCGDDRTHRIFTIEIPSNFFDINGVIARDPSYYGFFFDFDEIGTQSMMVVGKSTRNGDTVVSGYYNTLDADAFFIKVLGLNGASDDDVGKLGGMYYGPSFECQVTNIDGKAELIKGGQLSRGNYNALQLPYSLLGLGRTNNYVEHLVFGAPINGTNSHLWTPIIPNSQLIINTIGEPVNWKLDVFIRPTGKTSMVVGAAVAVLVVLGLIILYLHHQEKEEDKGGFNPMFNF